MGAADPPRIKKLVPYKHPNGIVRWVPLSPATETVQLWIRMTTIHPSNLYSAPHVPPE